MLHTSETKEDGLKEAIESKLNASMPQSPPVVEITRSETPSGEAIDERYETKPDKEEEGTDDQDGKPRQTDETVNEAVENDEEEAEEIAESVTEIEEIFQVSEDGVTWKTVKKITTITPHGTSERMIILGGI